MIDNGFERCEIKGKNDGNTLRGITTRGIFVRCRKREKRKNWKREAIGSEAWKGEKGRLDERGGGRGRGWGVRRGRVGRWKGRE